MVGGSKGIAQAIGVLGSTPSLSLSCIFAS